MSRSRSGCSSRAGYSHEYSQPSLPLLLPADDPVHAGEPVAGVGVADGVEEGFELAVEDGTGDELAAALALHEVPVGVDEDNLVAERFLGLGDTAGRDCQERRQKQRGCQGEKPPERPGFRFERQVFHLSADLLRFIGSQLPQKSVNNGIAIRNLPKGGAFLPPGAWLPPLSRPYETHPCRAVVGVYRERRLLGSPSRSDFVADTGENHPLQDVNGKHFLGRVPSGGHLDKTTAQGLGFIQAGESGGTWKRPSGNLECC